jgi:branched-chain amino acid transport system substrate-binding protein
MTDRWRGVKSVAVDLIPTTTGGKGLADAFKRPLRPLAAKSISAAHEDGKGDYSFRSRSILAAAGGEALVVAGYTDQAAKA